MAADFSNLSASASSTESDGAPAAADVEALISQTADLIVLEQIAALNTAHLSDSLLPTDLEARFRKLKSFPGAAHTKPRTPPHRRFSSDNERAPTSPPSTKPPPPPADSPNPESPSAKTSAPAIPDDAKKELDPKSRTGFVSAPSISPTSPERRRGQVCCFGFTPRRRVWRRRKKGSGNETTVTRRFGLDDELLSDLGPFSKEQRRRMRKVMREEEKVSREAEEMVEWVKQASARMMDAFSAIDELVSDDDDDDNRGDGKIK